MPSFKLLLPLLAATAVFAQSDECGSSGEDFTISDAPRATAVAQQCETVTGNLVFATGVADAVVLAGLKEVTGDLRIESNNDITNLGGNELEKIGGQFLLTADTRLGEINLPSLTEVGSIKWVSLAGLDRLTLTSQVTTAPSIEISDTRLNNLNGLNASSIDTLIVTDNSGLEDFSIQVSEIKNTLRIAENGEKANINFPFLEKAGSIELSRVAAVNMSNLETVDQGINLQGTMQNITMPNLMSADSLTIQNCTELEEIDFSGLNNIEGTILAGDNPKLLNLTFASLERVGGAVDIQGNFTDVELPNINRVVGAFNLQSTADINDVCSRFRENSGSGKAIDGVFTCTQTDTPENTEQGGSGSGNGNGGDEGAASHMSASALIAVTGLAMWYML